MIATPTPVPSTPRFCRTVVAPIVAPVRSIDPMVDYLPSTVESLRGTVLRLGLMSAADLSTALAQCRAHLRDPGTAFTMYTVAQVWGCKPA